MPESRSFQITQFKILSLSHHAVPESVIVQDKLADALGSLSVDALGGQQHVEQLEHGDDWMESDSLRSQHLHPTLLSVH